MINSIVRFAGNISSPKVILNRLKHVYNSAEAQSPAEYPMGLLTTEDRDTWATVRQHLVNTHNNDALKTIDSALFCVALDDENRPVDEFVNNVQNFLHGKDGGVINRYGLRCACDVSILIRALSLITGGTTNRCRCWCRRTAWPPSISSTRGAMV